MKATDVTTLDFVVRLAVAAAFGAPILAELGPGLSTRLLALPGVEKAHWQSAPPAL